MSNILQAITVKLEDDENLRDVLLGEFEKLSPEEGDSAKITATKIKEVLTRIMKNHIKAILSQKEDQENMIYELQ